MNSRILLALLACGAVAPAALADYTVTMNAIDLKGVGDAVGTVAIHADPKGGVTLVPDLKGLPPGVHGFHVHDFANCGAKEKDGKLEPGELAGPHWDPDKAGKHGAPAGSGHRGDLPPLTVAADGTATKSIAAPRLELKDLRRKSLMIHQGGDNFSDQPKPNGGGGTRIACGVIESQERGTNKGKR
jgi:Cu-Zn family superoxide dismutase